MPSTRHLSASVPDTPLSPSCRGHGATSISRWEAFKHLGQILGRARETIVPSLTAPQRMSIVRAAEEQHVTHTLALCADQFAALDLFPPPAEERLRSSLRGNTFRNLAISAQLHSIVIALNDKGMEPVLLKGSSYLLTGLHESAGFRYQADIDLLLEPELLHDACSVLLQAGYRPLADNGRAPDSMTGTLGAAELVRANAPHHHLPPLCKGGAPASVELHRHALPRRFQSQAPRQELFANARPGQYRGARFRMLAPEDQLTQLFLGTVVHDGFLGRRSFPLREACDYRALVSLHRTELDTETLHARGGDALVLFDQLTALLLDTPQLLFKHEPSHTRSYLGALRRRQTYDAAAQLYDLKARTTHLALSLIHSPGKLPAYLRRRLIPPG